VNFARWVSGAAPAFDADVLSWLGHQGVSALNVKVLPAPGLWLPCLTRRQRVNSYSRRLAEGRGLLVLPYLAGDVLLLALAARWRTLGVAVGSDVLRRRRHGRPERLFRDALRAFDAVWAVSNHLGAELAEAGRAPDWVAPVGVDLGELANGAPPPPEPGRLFSPRGAAPLYRTHWIRAVSSTLAGTRLVEAHHFTRGRMLEEYSRAQVVISVPESDGAPASLMEALCCGAHVIGSGGPTVRDWLTRFGGTYGEPGEPGELRSLVLGGLAASAAESTEAREVRARQARAAFDRDRALHPLLQVIEQET